MKLFSVDAWTRNKKFSDYTSFILPDGEDKPSNAIKRGNAWVPVSPDGYTIGNSKIFVAIGMPPTDIEHIHNFYTNSSLKIPFINEFNCARVSLLMGPNKDYYHLQNIPAVWKVQDFQLCYEIENEILDIPCSDINYQTSRRVSNTSIIHTTLKNRPLQAEIIDFCPKNPDAPCFYRVITLKNKSNQNIRNIAFNIVLEHYGRSWNWIFHKDDNILEITEKKDNMNFFIKLVGIGELATRVDANKERPLRFSFLNKKPDNIKGEKAGFINYAIIKPVLGAWEELTFGIKFDTTGKIKEAVFQEDNIESVFKKLDNTEKSWKNGVIRVKFSSDDSKLEALVDALVSMNMNHISEKGIHSGSVYYSHGRAWTRDNYWNQRGYQVSGYQEPAFSNVRFFLNAMKQNEFRFANSYNLDNYSSSIPNCDPLIELPSYYILMLADLRKYAPEKFVKLPQDEIKRVINTFLNEIRFTDDFTIPLNSDETWIWPCDVSETGVVLDNSLLTISALIVLKSWLKEHLSNAQLQKINNLHKHLTSGLKKFIIDCNESRLAVAIDDDGIQDETIITNVLSRPFVLDLNRNMSPEFEEIFLNGVIKCWQNCKHPLILGGMIARSHSATSAMTGNSPGYLLEALGKINARTQGDQILEGIMNFVNCTGTVNELHDIYDPSWGTERRRMWDSQVILAGVMQYILGTVITQEYVEFTPYCPIFCNKIGVDNLDFAGSCYSFRMERKNDMLFIAVKKDGKEIAKFQGLHKLRMKRKSRVVELIEVADISKQLFIQGNKHDFWKYLQYKDPLLIYEDDKINHAIEIARQVAFTLNKNARFLPESEFQDFNRGEIGIWLSTSPPSILDKNLFFKEVLDELSTKSFNFIKPDPRDQEKILCWIPCKEHVYKDTNKFIQGMRIFLLPKRIKPVNMHPHGFLRFSDYFGGEINEKIKIKVDCKNENEISDFHPSKFNLFIQGEEIKSTNALPFNWSGELDVGKHPIGIKKTSTFLMINSVTPFAPFDLAAAGIAEGKHAVKITIQGESITPIIADIEIHLPQTWHPQNLRSPQWERLVDRVFYHKLADGSKLLTISLHLGNNVNRHIRNAKYTPKARHLTFVFVKYPKI